MKCPTCAAELADGARCCTNCGADQPKRCASCGMDLPPAARYCPGCGQPVRLPDPRVEPSEIARVPAGERRQVTVLFADFAGFTAFVHKKDAEDVRDVMNAAWD